MEEYNREKTVIELSAANTQQGLPDFYAQLELPADDLAIYDTLQKLRAVDRNVGLDIHVINSPFLPELTDTVIDGANINELNILAGQLEALYQDDYDALQKMYALFRYNKESGLYDDGVPLSDLINMTVDLDGVNCYKFIDNSEELGMMVVDGEIDERFSDVSDDILDLIDRKKVGLDQMKKDKGIFYDGNYYTTAVYEIPKVHTSVTQADKLYSNPQAAFRLQISGRSRIGKYAGIKRELTLPVDRTEADRLAQECGEKRIEDCLVVHAETAIPQIMLQTYKGFEDFSKLNAIAKAFMSMSEHQRMAFKAILQNEQPRTLDDVIDRARNIDAYELESSAYAEPDFYKLYLIHHLETRFDPKWLDGIVSNDTEQELLRRLHAAVTDYGIVSSKNQPLYRIVPYDEPEKYELIEILGHPALFSNGRISQSELPDGLYRYDLRSGDETDFVTVEKNVAVNHAGTVVLKEPLDFGGRDYIPLDEDTSPNFTGEDMDLEEFQQTDFCEDQNMKIGGM